MDSMQNGIDVPLFDSKLLEDLDISNFVGSINLNNLQKYFKVRPLCQSDYEKEFTRFNSTFTFSWYDDVIYIPQSGLSGLVLRAISSKYSMYMFTMTGDNGDPIPCLLPADIFQNPIGSRYINLLSQLTTVGDISFEQFSARFNAMKSCPDTYYITVIEDLLTNQVIGTASLVIEQKFIHSASSRGRIEDVVVSDEYRGKQLGKLLLDILVSQSKKLGCYKVSLECKTLLLPYYSRFGFIKEKDNNYMVLRYKD